ncbi:unnamed protein product, partial [Sphenostylis stenocarpa]
LALTPSPSPPPRPLHPSETHIACPPLSPQPNRGALAVTRAPLATAGQPRGWWLEAR